MTANATNGQAGDVLPCLLLALVQLAFAQPDIRVSSNLVLVPVSVVDEQEQPVHNLGRDAFQILDRGQSQQIDSFTVEDGPASVGIVLDLSSSMKGDITRARQAISTFLDRAYTGDEFLLVSFSNRPELTLPFTTDTTAVAAAASLGESRGATALLDSLSLALTQMRGARWPRKALLILSDGDDTRSHLRFETLERSAIEADVRLFAIAPRAPASELSTHSFLPQLAARTGGRYFEASNTLDWVAKAALVDVHRFYSLGFRPAPDKVSGKLYRLRVSVNQPHVSAKHLRVSARRGYVAP